MTMAFTVTMVSTPAATQAPTLERTKLRQGCAPAAAAIHVQKTAVGDDVSVELLQLKGEPQPQGSKEKQQAEPQQASNTAAAAAPLTEQAGANAEAGPETAATEQARAEQEQEKEEPQEPQA